MAASALLWSGHSIDDAYSTSQIVLVSTISQQGYTGEYYENRAYTCGVSGYQTFLIVYADGLPMTTERPLWVRMHGGGVGAYNALGEYVPVELVSANNQESMNMLAGIMNEDGLVSMLRGHPVGFRFLLPSRAIMSPPRTSFCTAPRRVPSAVSVSRTPSNAKAWASRASCRTPM